MYTRGIRGAITVAVNAKSEIEAATVELLKEMMSQNGVEVEDIAYAMFTLTKDLNAGFPAKYARLNLRFDMVPMTCCNELDVPGAIEKCLRILLVVNTDKKQNEMKHIYLRGAKSLRPDISDDSLNRLKMENKNTKE